MYCNHISAFLCLGTVMFMGMHRNTYIYSVTCIITESLLKKEHVVISSAAIVLFLMALPALKLPVPVGMSGVSPAQQTRASQNQPTTPCIDESQRLIIDLLGGSTPSQQPQTLHKSFLQKNKRIQI